MTEGLLLLALVVFTIWALNGAGRSMETTDERI
jgi:hypothetical protein